MTVHNHGTEDGLGLACPERKLPDGTLAGLCNTTPERARFAEALRRHYLTEVVCDHEEKLDNPICACSRVHLGWHPSVGGAVDAWIGHVLEQLD